MATAAHPLHHGGFFKSEYESKWCWIIKNALHIFRAPRTVSARLAAAQGDERPERLPDDLPALRHMGIYAYRVGFLKRYGALPVSVLEQIESLEQLRVLAHGEKISVYINHQAAAPVDTLRTWQSLKHFCAPIHNRFVLRHLSDLTLRSVWGKVMGSVCLIFGKISCALYWPD